jgi:hypothetical protein
MATKRCKHRAIVYNGGERGDANESFALSACYIGNLPLLIPWATAL